MVMVPSHGPVRASHSRGVVVAWSEKTEGAPALTYAEVVAARRAEDLDHLLILWHNWQGSARLARGYGCRSAVVGEYRVSRQYDDVSGVLDDDLDDERCKQVQFHVEEMHHPWRTAVYTMAMNLACGLAVWSNPRLPSDPAELARVNAEARAQLLARLMAAGLID